MKRVFVLLFLSVLLLSCSDDKAAVVSVQSTVIFEYRDNENPPEMSLAFFVQTSSDVQRADRITVFHPDTGYIWEARNPIIYSGNSKEYACYTKFKAPVKEVIPCGSYDVTYIDAAGEEDVQSVTVSYSEGLISSTALTAKSFIGSHHDESVALYDKDKKLLYFGKNKSNWKQNGNIVNDYRDAASKRVFYTASSGTIVCILPEESLQGIILSSDNEDNNE